MNPFFLCIFFTIQLYLMVFSSCPFVSYILHMLIYLFVICNVHCSRAVIAFHPLNNLTTLQPPTFNFIW
jgi:hypothetical protein